MNGFYNIISQKSRQTGFSLLEVLIAIVITSIGLLGLAGMQATGLRNNHSAYHRSQATVLAYDIADRMRSNAGTMISYVTPVEEETPVDEIPIDVATPQKDMTPAGIQSFDGGLDIVIVQVADVEPEVEDPLAGCKTTGGCTAAQLAQNDLAEWNADLAAALSGGSGSISLTGGIYTISVSWDDNRDGLVDVNDPGLQVSFQP